MGHLTSLRSYLFAFICVHSRLNAVAGTGLEKQLGNILLVGTRASGKSAVGRRAAEVLGGGWGFVEMDAALVQRLGTSIAECFRVRGEAAFREAEAAFLADLAGNDRQIVACGGGIAGTPESVAAARQAGTLVWLEAPAAVLLARRLADPDEGARPALLPALSALKAADLDAYLRVEIPTILSRRAPHYAQAHFTIATEGLSVERLAGIVAAVAGGQ